MATTSPEHPAELSRVVGMVKDWVERCGQIWVEAQVIELKRRAAVTQFLTLRDRNDEVSAQVTCSKMVLDTAGPVTEGQTVVALLQPRVWHKTAQLSFECHDLRIAGEGALLARVEQLKRKLQAEGLFDPARKKRLPFLPRAIGVVTGADSAAERDVITNVTSRWPATELRIRHSLVQGPDAAASVMRELAALDADPDVDVIIIARGGGSFEDLLPFSDEGLVRAVAAAKTPIITGVGHDPDFPLVDFAADVRASTPTDAAKRVVPDAAEQAQGLADARARLRRRIVEIVAHEQRGLDQIRSRPVLREPAGTIVVHQERLGMLRLKLDAAIDRVLERETSWLATGRATMRAMSPRNTLERGYAIILDGAGAAVTSVGQVDPDDDLLAQLADGHLVVGVRDVMPETRRRAE